MKPRTIERLADVAICYRLAIAEGRSPVDAVARKLHITGPAAKQRIRRARRAGLLAQHRGVFDTTE